MPEGKNKKTLLITAIGGDIGHAFAKAVAGEEFFLIGCDVRSVLDDHGLFERCFRVPPASHVEEYLGAIREIAGETGADLIVPISEPEIKAFHERREAWASWKNKVLINNEVILNHFLDKYNTVTYLQSIGIRVPQTWLLKAYTGQLAFPMIIKKRSGCGNKGTWKVESEIDLNYFRQKDDGSFLVQEYLGRDDQEFTTGIFSDGKNTASITFKRRLGMGGLSVEVDLADAPELEHKAQTIARHTQLRGSINVQSRFSDGVYIPFEINPRLSSTLSFRKAFGFCDCLWWPRVCLGGAFKYQRQYKAGRGARYLAESYSQMDRI
jgi:carbamoyl-phosphate synthase large subunit